MQGSIRNRFYEDRNGVRHKTFEINADKVTFLDRIKGSDTTDTLPAESTAEAPM